MRRREAHEILVRRDLRNRVAVERTRVDIDRHLSLFHRAHGALQERRDVKIGEVAEEADVERMPEHIVELRGAEFLDLLRVPFVDVKERDAIPLRLYLGPVVSPAANEVNGADHIVKITAAEDFGNSRLILEVADLDARLDRVLFLEFCHEGEVFVERILELVLLQPLLLKTADEGVVQDKIIVIERFKLRKRVTVLGKADLRHAARRRRPKESFHPRFIVRAVFQMHMIVELHDLPPCIFPSSSSRRRMRSTPCCVLGGAICFAAAFAFGCAFSIA